MIVGAYGFVRIVIGTGFGYVMIPRMGEDHLVGDVGCPWFSLS